MIHEASKNDFQCWHKVVKYRTNCKYWYDAGLCIIKTIIRINSSGFIAGPSAVALWVVSNATAAPTWNNTWPITTA